MGGRRGSHGDSKQDSESGAGESRAPRTTWPPSARVTENTQPSRRRRRAGRPAGSSSALAMSGQEGSSRRKRAQQRYCREVGAEQARITFMLLLAAVEHSMGYSFLFCSRVAATPVGRGRGCRSFFLGRNSCMAFCGAIVTEKQDSLSQDDQHLARCAPS